MKRTDRVDRLLTHMATYGCWFRASDRGPTSNQWATPPGETDFLQDLIRPSRRGRICLKGLRFVSRTILAFTFSFVLLISAAARAEVRVLAYGDSNTWGFKPTVEGDFLPRYSDSQRWSGVMRDALGPAYAVEVNGIPGRSLNFDLPGGLGALTKQDGNGLRRLALSVTQDAPVNLVIVMLGTNDLIHKPRPTPHQIAAGLEKLVRIAETATVAYAPTQKQRLLFVVPAPLHDTSHGPFKDDFDARAVQESKDLAEAFLNEGRRLGVPVFDAGSIVKVEGIDGVHLTEAAHRQLGEAIAREVKAIVQP